jgi:hypothetical protein
MLSHSVPTPCLLSHSVPTPCMLSHSVPTPCLLSHSVPAPCLLSHSVPAVRPRGACTKTARAWQVKICQRAYNLLVEKVDFNPQVQGRGEGVQ